MADPGVDRFWQGLVAEPPPGPPYADAFGARMPDGRFLLQPLRRLPADPARAVASLIVTQASFAVERALAAWLAEIARRFRPEIVVGLPTLGLILARGVAERLGHANWVAAGFSRKFWYDEALSEPASSITSPDARRLWLDPRMLPRLEDKRVLLVDDVVSTGTSAAAALRLLEKAGAPAVALAVAMVQTDRWRGRLPEALPVAGVFATPLFREVAGGWAPMAETLAAEACPLLSPR